MTTPTSHARASASILRQPVVHPDRSIFAYAVRGIVPDGSGLPMPEESVEHLVDAMLRTIDLTRLAGERPLVIRPTRSVLANPEMLVDLPHGVVVEVAPHLQPMPTATERLGALAEAGVRLALGDFTGSAPQVALLPYVQMVKIDAAQDARTLAELTAQAASRGAVVVAENATTRDRVDAALEAGAEFLQGPLVLEQRPVEPVRSFSVGEIQCLEVIRLVSGPAPDPSACAQTVASDPELSIRVLHLVNSSAMGVRHKVDSVHRAVVLVGPRQLGALATAALVGSTPAAMETLWYLLTRATAVSGITGDDTGYTVGLLSAVAAQLKVAPSQVVSRTGVSHDVAAALEHHAGRYGQALAAVLAQEKNDPEALAATGLNPYDVGRVYLDAVSSALSLASRLAAAS